MEGTRPGSTRPGMIRRHVTRAGGTSESRRDAPGEDTVAVEEPLQIRIAGEPVAVTMRTPGDDERLVLGFLLSEGIIRSIDDVASLARCGRPGEEGYGNVIDVLPGPGVSLDIDRVEGCRRGTLTTTSCGVCGRRSIADLLARCEVLSAGPVVQPQTICGAMDRLRTVQPIFAATGGTHAAAALDGEGEVLAAHEDVGRHNAVDKVVGALLYRRLCGAGSARAPRPAVLLVSGRASFEMVQKAATAGIPVLASVSAPSSLAIDLAARCGVTLIGFLRGDSFNVYSHGERVPAR